MNQKKIGIILTYITQVVHILTGLLYTPIMLRLLGQSEYGLYQLVATVIAYLSLLSMGFSASYVRYYARYEAAKDNDGEARLNGMFMIVFCCIALIALISGVLMIQNIEYLFDRGLNHKEIATARILMMFMLFNMVISFPTSVFVCIVTAHERFFFQRMLGLAYAVFNPIFALPLLYFGFGSIGMVVISTILTVCRSVVNVYYCLRKIKVKFIFGNFNWPLLKEIWAFTFFIFLNQIIDQINWNVGKFLLGRYIGTYAVAVFGIAALINSLYISLSTAISSVFVPKVNKIVAESNDNKSLTDLMIRIGRIQFIVLMLVLSGFVFFGQVFIRLWAGKDYVEAYGVTLLLIVPVTIPIIQNLGIEIQRSRNKHRARSIAYFFIALINIMASIPLIDIYGVVGAALGSALSLFLGNGLFMNWYYHTKLGLDMLKFWRNILSFLKALLLPFVTGIALLIFIDQNNLATYLISISLYVTIYCVSIWKLGLSENEKLVIGAPFMKLINKYNEGKNK